MLKQIVGLESIVPSVEALAAVKYCSIISPLRTRKEQDAVDFRDLVRLAGFDTPKCLSFFVSQFEPLRQEVADVIKRIQRGDTQAMI